MKGATSYSLRPLVLALAGAALLSGCTTFAAPNPPLSKWDPSHGYRRTLMQDERPVGPVVMVLAFSGGGTRAAAFSYGVLQELRDTEVVVGGKRERLLDEVDLISSVSGGSFTSAYYGLFGDQIFEDYETRFLRRNVTGEMIRALLNPINWFRMLFTQANRTELAIRLYDKEIFSGATFADLDAANGPYLQINATDLAAGSRFTFVQPQFDLICSDLHPFSVARAVAASSAVPVVFDAITLENYAGSCGFELPSYLQDALEQPRRSRRRYQLGKAASSYLDAKRRPYVHLVDGGVVDNQGLLAPMEMVEMMGGIKRRFHDFGVDSPEHIVVIAVDAEVDPQPDFSRSPKPPSLAAVVGSMTGMQINRMTFETIERMRQSLKVWARELPPGPDGQPPQVHMIELAFDLIEDPADRAYFDGLPTSFSLDDEQVDRLIAAGRELLRQSPQYQDLLRAIGGVSPNAGGAELPTRSN